MLTLNNPAEIKPADVYRQARLVASKTSRGLDRNWYRSAFELPWQWHIWFDGGRQVVSATYFRGDSKWGPGPPIPLAGFTTGDGVKEMLARLMSREFFSQKPKALGVVLHMADEFALAELNQELNRTEETVDLQMLNYRLMDDPRSVLIDRDVNEDATSWRLLPYWGAPQGHSRGTAIALPRSREGFLSRLVEHGEELHLPVRVAVTAAAVEALASLPLLEPRVSGARLVVFLYPKFSAVFAMLSTGELCRARSLLHRNDSLSPNGIGDILWSMAVGEELTGGGENRGTEPIKVLLVSTNKSALESAEQELESYCATRQKLSWQKLDPTASPALAHIPSQRPEFLIHDSAAVEKARSGQGEWVRSKTFQSLWNESGARCNYFDTARMDMLYPTLRDLQILRLSRLFVALMTLSLIGLSCYGLYSYVTAMTHPSWALTAQQIKRTEESLARLQLEKRQIEVTDQLLLPRSRGWVALEFFLQTFPEDSNVRVEACSYGMEAGRLNPSGTKGQGTQRVGFIRTWSVRGLAKEGGLEALGRLNSQRGLSALFQQVAEATGDDSYALDSARQLKIALNQGRNPKFNNKQNPAEMPQEPSTAYPFSFDATITQTVPDSDPLALPLEKPF